MTHRILIAAIIILTMTLGPNSPRTNAQQQPPKHLDTHGREWWQNAVFYEIYPRSFADSNNDGIGDLNGITSKLDYLHDLGVDALWITPCFPSPQVDFGYDVSDYENIDPMYGTLADFDRLVAEAKKRHIKIILDFVVNHSSDQHKWFLESRSSRDNKYRDWYIWRDGKGPGQPPNNWQSEFGLPAWTWDEKTKQWYYNYFYPQQPDLNWRNPAVHDAMMDATRFWYKRGVAGFRLDAVDTLFEDPDLKDNPSAPGKDKFGRPNFARIHNTKLPEVHDVLRDLRKVADEYGAVLIGETWTKDIHELMRYYGTGNELQMPMDLMFTSVKTLSAPEFRAQIAAVDTAGGWPVFVISNHDIVRAATRYTDGTHTDEIAKIMATLYLTLRGSPIMYYGEEIGMVNTDPTRKEDVKDVQALISWPTDKGRDGERTPMQWNTTPNAGFTKGKPWLPVPASYKTYNVATESKNPDSVLNTYKHVIALRRSEPALLTGSYTALNPDDPNVLAYLRKENDDTVVVALNMSATPQKLNLTSAGLASPKLKVLLSTTKLPDVSDTTNITLQPYAALIAKVTK